ncbi:MAG TPA: DUF1566 domain-containing protein [Terriglobales bacterium]|nr:DUF1566 domain-containing protein [Terriglobales bacterium]
MTIQVLRARLGALCCALRILNRVHVAQVMVGVAVCLGVISAPGQAAGLPLVISATVDYTQGTLTISGQNFGSSPAVTLDSLAFPTQSSVSSKIVANFPNGKAPSSFTPGTYFLTVQFKNQLPSIFAVDIGANGALGPVGPAGAQGLPGAQGPPGAAGPAGPQGLSGPMGPPGAAGAQGLPGIAGPRGPTGASGGTGAPGPQGPPGKNGTNGTGAPVCAASDTVVSFQGLLVCKSTLPRFVDNGDGTVTDNTTGLMWEKKSAAGTGDVHDVSNLYAWNRNDTTFDPNGELYSRFLQQLNGLDSAGGISGGTACFAGRCDWRIPEISELRSILSAPYPTCASAPCIDPIFIPAQPDKHWSSSSEAGANSSAWYVDFSNGSVFSQRKIFQFYARAVRNVR